MSYYTVTTVMGTIIKTGKVANTFKAKNRLYSKLTITYGSAINIAYLDL